MTAHQPKSSKFRSVAPRSAAPTHGTLSDRQRAPAPQPKSKSGIALLGIKTDPTEPQRQQRLEHDVASIGVPKPRTGQAAVDLAFRAGVTTRSGTLKLRFR